MVAHPLAVRPLRVAPLSAARGLLDSGTARLARLAALWLFAAAALVVAGYIAAGSLSAAAWWTFNSGPLTGDPEIVLTEPSPVGAVRVYEDTPDLPPEESARFAVNDLAAAGGFARATIVVALPTGSGWVDPKQIDALEQSSAGDIATVSMRYSRAPSGAVYALRPDVAADAAHALIAEVTDRLRTMDPATRPHLIVHGQSLGAQAGEAALADDSLLPLVSAAVWQGLPGAESAGSSNAASLGECTISAVNPDDPVTKLSWNLLRDPAEAVSVLASLPGSESKPPGTAHSYAPVLPPDSCLATGTGAGHVPLHGAVNHATVAGNRVR